MRVVAVLATAVFVALVVARATGGMPSLVRPRRAASTSRTQRLLREAGVEVPAPVLHLASAGAAALAFATVGGIAGVWPLGVLPAGVAGLAPRLLLQRRAGARLQAVRGAWPDAVAQLSGVIRSGRTLNEAMRQLAGDPPDALRPLLEGLPARVRTVGTIGALHAVADTAGEPVTDRVVEVLCIAHEAGGRVVPDILDDLSHAIAEEIRVADELQQLSHEGRLNAKLVFVLPWLVLVLLTSGGGPYQAFYSSGPGTAIIVVASVLSAAGMAVVSRLASRRDDPQLMVQVGR